MIRNNVVFLVAGLLIAGSISFAVAEPFEGPDDAAPDDMGPPDMPMMWHGHHHGMMARDGGPMDPAEAVIMDIRGIARLDRMAGHDQDLATLYQHVLDTTKNPQVRQYAYRHLARSQMKPANVDKAMATLRKSLDEDLERLNAGSGK